MTFSFRYRPYSERPMWRATLAGILLFLVCSCIGLIVFGAGQRSDVLIVLVLVGIVSFIASGMLILSIADPYHTKYDSFFVPSRVSSFETNEQGLWRNTRLLLNWTDVKWVNTSHADHLEFHLQKNDAERFWKTNTFDLWVVQRVLFSPLVRWLIDPRWQQIRKGNPCVLPRRGYEPDIDILEAVRPHVPAGLIGTPDRPGTE